MASGRPLRLAQAALNRSQKWLFASEFPGGGCCCQTEHMRSLLERCNGGGGEVRSGTNYLPPPTVPPSPLQPGESQRRLRAVAPAAAGATYRNAVLPPPALRLAQQRRSFASESFAMREPALPRPPTNVASESPAARRK